MKMFSVSGLRNAAAGTNVERHHSQGTAALVFTADTPFCPAGFAATFVVVLDDTTEAAGIP